jgi:LPS-assembly protein
VIRRLSLFFLFALPAFAQSVVPRITAEHQETDARTNETILTGNPRIEYGDVSLTADVLHYNPAGHVVVARGHAILSDGPRRLLADVITYHVDNGAYEVGDLRFGEYPFYLTGSSATGTKDSLVIHDVVASIPEPGGLIPTLHADRLFLSSVQKIRAEHASLGLGSVRPFSFGSFQHNFNDPLISYFSLGAGYRAALGAFTEIGLHLPVAPSLEVGGDLGVYTNRGVMIGPSGTYSGGTGDTEYEGSFGSGYIDDHGKRFTDILGRPVPHDRSYLEWRHRQKIGARLTLSGEINYWSDSEVLRDFRPQAFFPVQQPDNHVEAVYAGDNYFVSAFTRFQPNAYESVQQRLPEIRFDLMPLALGRGFYERFNASYAMLRHNPPDGSPTLTSNRLDAYYALSRPVRLRDWLTVTPVAGGRLTYYADAIGGRSTYTRALGELGFDAEMRTSGIYHYKNERWKIDGIRHLLTPRLSYRYIPEADKGAAYIPPIDDNIPYFSTYLQPLGLGDRRNIDELSGTNTLRLSLDNTFQTRDPKYGSRDLLTFNVANDFRFQRKPGERDVSETHIELGLMPARWLEVSAYQSFAPQNFSLHEFNTGVTLRDGDAWTARVSSNFLRDEIEDYLLDGQVRLTEAYEAVAHVRYDAHAALFTEQTYGIRQNLNNAWHIEYLVSFYAGQRRENHFGLNIRIEALTF